MNRVTLVGNLTRDVELRRTQSGMAVLNIGIAVNNRRKNNHTGEWEDEPCYVDCVMFGTRAESLANYLHKGNKVGIDGKLRYSSWERDGNRRSKLEVLVDDLEMLTPKGQNGSGGGYGAPGQQAGGYAYGSGSAPQTAPQQAQAGYQQPQQGYQQQPAQQPQQQPQIDASSSVYDDDIPF